MIINFKKLHPDAVLPKYAKSGDAAMDLVCTEIADDKGGVITYYTGLAAEIPEGYVGLLFPRSSIYKTELQLCNSIGVIDSSYRGEIAAKFYGYLQFSRTYTIGDRICQLIILPFPKVSPVFVDTLSSSDRGESGFGSTGA